MSWEPSIGYRPLAEVHGVAELGGTDDPRKLVPGDPEAINDSLHGFRTLGAAMSRAAEGLAGTEASDWQGAAGDAFRDRFAGKPRDWQNAGDAFWQAGEALIGYRDVLRTAQADAAQAITWHAEAEAATERAAGEYRTAAEHYNTALAAGQDPGARPEWSDPGQDLRTKAETLLADARARVRNAGYDCAQVISDCTGRLPEQPDAWDRFWMDLEDQAAYLGTQTTDAVAGAVGAVGEMISLSRSVNPLDPYNMLHPEQYAANMKTLAAGLAHAATHPTETVLAALDVETWKDSPGRALGALLPDAVLGAVTGGSALAAKAGGRTATAAAHEAVEDSGTAGRHAVESAGRHAPDVGVARGSGETGGVVGGISRRLDELRARLVPQAATVPSSPRGGTLPGPPVPRPPRVGNLPATPHHQPRPLTPPGPLVPRPPQVGTPATGTPAASSATSRPAGTAGGRPPERRSRAPGRTGRPRRARGPAA